ncbi:NUDIX hydrolase [Grimontia celer]|uniref:NUDIX hydrolase n=1 Tax=Grimontia celer TaxID=1796497 RepID=UPI00078905D3|nr:NUDIX domain-containing protein [Grimontia celer]
MSLRRIKVCPLVLREIDGEMNLLLFKHPLAGIQLVKGTVEPFDISYESAAKRELTEESGISYVLNTTYLGSWESGYQDQFWHFVLCQVGETLPKTWCFYTQDDGGHEFQFFWHRLGDPIPNDCHKLFCDAIQKVQELIR